MVLRGGGMFGVQSCLSSQAAQPNPRPNTSTHPKPVSRDRNQFLGTGTKATLRPLDYPALSWGLKQVNPSVITKFPSPGEIKDHHAFQPDADRLASEPVASDFIALTQLPNYASEAGWKNEDERSAFVDKNNLRFLRDYQKRAVHAVQRAVKKGDVRFLFEMATGTGKTLTSAAIIKIFLKTRNARRVLFLVDRIELEIQADKAFKALLKNDFTCVIYKEQKDDWRKADIVVTTVQSLLFNDKFRRAFAPTDFDLVISDEAHRSIGGNARAVFEYFVGYKLGLTATPKDYVKQSKKASAARDPRETERRMLLDTYRTFGCESGEPTFRYSLLDGVKDGFLINPYVVDARTEITTQLLSDEGFTVDVTDEDGNEVKEAFGGTLNAHRRVTLSSNLFWASFASRWLPSLIASTSARSSYNRSSLRAASGTDLNSGLMDKPLFSPSAWGQTCMSAPELTSCPSSMGAAKPVVIPRSGAPGLTGNTYFSPCWTNSVRLRRFTFGRSLDLTAKLAARLRLRDALISVLLIPKDLSRLRTAKGSEPSWSSRCPWKICSSRLSNFSNMTMS